MFCKSQTFQDAVHKTFSTQPGCYEQMIGKWAIINLLLERHIDSWTVHRWLQIHPEWKAWFFFLAPVAQSISHWHFCLGIAVPQGGIWILCRNRWVCVKAAAFPDNIQPPPWISHYFLISEYIVLIRIPYHFVSRCGIFTKICKKSGIGFLDSSEKTHPLHCITTFASCKLLEVH